MKRFALSLAAIAALALFSNSAMAGHRRHSNLHYNLNHNEFHRIQTHNNAHRYLISYRQHHRLHDYLQHDRYHDVVRHDRYHHRRSYRSSIFGIGIRTRHFGIRFGH